MKKTLSFDQYFSITLNGVNGSVKKTSAAETSDMNSILGRVRLKTIKIGIYSFAVSHSAWRQCEMWSLHRIW